ncbi:MAG: two-component regulator propeller domain-containing protein [Acidobacteriota bacterium]
MVASFSAKYFFCALLLWCALAARGASAQYRFDSWTTDSGLPQNSVRSILQTRDGYLWFTTLDGVVRYDGVRFRVFDKSNTRGIESNRFFLLTEDRAGALWMATEDGGVTRYKDGAFASYTAQDGLPSNTVRNLHLDDSGDLFVHTAGGIARWDGEKFLPHSPRAKEPSEGIIYRDREGAVWHHDRDALRRSKEGHTIAFPLRIGDARIWSLCLDNGGRLWIGISDGRLLSLKDGAFTSHAMRFPPSVYVAAMLEDQRGNLWLGTNGSGLIRFKDGKFTYYTTAHGLSDDSVASLFEDREGTIWAGTLNRGINRLSRQIISVYSAKDGMTGDSVYPIYEDPRGEIWIGARGLNRFTDGRFVAYRQKDGLLFYDAMSLFEDREGRLWIGAVGGLSYFERGRFTDFTAKTGLQPHNFNVWAINQDRSGALWFGTDHGLIRYKDEKITLYTTRDGLAGDDVKAIHLDRNGDLWFGTYSGLSVLKDGRFISFTESDGLAGNRVRAIYEDEEGTLWIGTYDAGMSRLKDGRFTNYTARDGLTNNGVFQILDDGRGNFWMSSNRGIYRVSRRQLDDFAEGRIGSLTSVSYGKEDGLVNTECNGGRQPSGVRARDGRLWFPTQGGVAVIDVASLATNPLPPPVVIEDVILNREQIGFNEGVRIDPGRENLEIHYTGLSFIKPEQMRFRYRMEGLDSDWIEAGNRRAAYYPYLPPGSYTFVVRAANSDGVWSEQEQRLLITVLPPFWRTWWFAALSSLALAAAALLVYRRRVAALKRAHSAQEAFSRQLIESQERERKRIASELHDSLGQNLLVIKNWAMIGLGALKDGERGRDELQEISSTATQSINEVREIAYNLRPHLLDEVGLTEALRAMLKKVAASSGIEFFVDVDAIDDLFTKPSEISVYRIVQEGVNNIVRHAEARSAQVTVRRDGREVTIRISDDGRGFDQSSGKGLGLVGVSERARMLGGKFNAHSAPDEGTTVTVKVMGDG